MTFTLSHFIGGERVAAEPSCLSLNPSHLADVVAEVPEGDASVLDAAISAASAAAPGWAELSPERRADILDKTGSLLLERVDELGTLLSREEGKTLAEGRGEVTRAGRIFRYFGGEALRRHGQILESVRPGVEVAIRREALGVIGLITPWNFPIAIPAWKAAPALAFGNTVVMKAAAITPCIASALVDVLVEAGLPNGVFNLVFIRGSVAGGLARDPRIKGLSFTGSTNVGRGLAADAVANGIRIQLEMGGKNPLVVLDDADLELAVTISLDGGFLSSGQRCTASSRLIVMDEIHDRFVEALAQRLRSIKVGHALAPDTQIGPVSSQEQVDTITGYLDIARREGARIYTGGERLCFEHEGYYLSPALITETTPSMRVNREEIFGPVASVLRVKTYEEALAAANDSKFGLSAGIVTTSLKHAQDFQRRVRAGMVMVNLPTAGVDYHVPFGGMKDSSYGPREQGFAALEFYTQTKTGYVAW
jgi:aldehyde dehydrogenase (NAD+)